MKWLIDEICSLWYWLLCWIARRPLADQETYYLGILRQIEKETQDYAYQYATKLGELTRDKNQLLLDNDKLIHLVEELKNLRLEFTTPKAAPGLALELVKDAT